MVLHRAGYAALIECWDNNRGAVLSAVGPFPTRELAQQWGEHAESFGHVDYLRDVIELDETIPPIGPARPVLQAVA